MFMISADAVDRALTSMVSWKPCERRFAKAPSSRVSSHDRKAGRSCHDPASMPAGPTSPRPERRPEAIGVKVVTVSRITTNRCRQ
jgi:hypothetical protein